MSVKTILVLSPHTDDGELGCGASINRYAEEGNTIIHIAFSVCKESLATGLLPDTLATEAKKANAVLGVKPENLLLLDYPVRRFDDNRQSILDEMIALQKQYKPTTVFIPSTTCNVSNASFNETVVIPCAGAISKHDFPLKY